MYGSGFAPDIPAGERVDPETGETIPATKIKDMFKKENRMPGIRQNIKEGHKGIAALQALGIGLPLIMKGTQTMLARPGTASKPPATTGVAALQGGDREAIAAARQAQAETSKTRRLGTTGQYVGAPRRVDSPQALGRLRSDYLGQVKEGLAGKDWYMDSSRWARGVSGTDDEAQRLADILAVTSANTPVGSNLGFTVRGLEQAAVGAPIQTGRFPSTQSRPILEILRTAGTTMGPKRTPFADNLGIAWNKNIASNPVHDIWQGRAMGYESYSSKLYPTRKKALAAVTNKKGERTGRVIKEGDGYRTAKPWETGFSEAQHAFMDREMATIVKMLNAGKVGGKTNWTPAEAQAAAWTGTQIRAGVLSAEDAAKHYGSFAERYVASVTHEAAPGRGTGHLEGFLELPKPRREAFAADPRSSWVDETGRDALYGATVIPVEESISNIGSFRPLLGGGLETNPGVVARPLVQTREIRRYKVLVNGESTEVYAVGSGKIEDKKLFLASEKSPTSDGPVVIPDEGTTFKQVGPKTAELTPEARILMETIESPRAFFDVQNAAAAHRVIPNSQNVAGRRTSLTIPLDRKLTEKEIVALDEIAGRNGMFVVDSGKGVRLINEPFSEIGKARKAGKINLNRERKGKDGIYEQVINAIDEPAGSVKVVPAQIDTVYENYESLWRQGIGSGAATTRMLDDVERVPVIRDAIEPVLQRKAAMNIARDETMAKSSGLAVRSDVQEARRIFIAKGFAGLREALNNGAILPAVAAAVVAPAVLFSQNGNQQM